jgi:hypothetical protein
MNKLPALKLGKDQERRLQAGHVWVYSNEVDAKETPLKSFSAGQQVAVVSQRGKWVGNAYVNPHALICARLVSSGINKVLDDELLKEHTKNADIAIHECFIAPNDLVKLQNWSVKDALNVGTQVHTSPAQFGKVMSEIKPRMAVAYHFFNDHNTREGVLKLICGVYDGPLALSVDYMVFNVKKGEDVKVRMAVIDEDIWPLPSITEKKPADPNDRVGFSDFITGGRVSYPEIVEKVYEDTNKTFGTSVPAPD